MNLPSLDNLRCFEAAARAPSFRAAAREVALTPAALGQRIRQLEDQLGARLFERTTRSITLTQAGLALVPRAREVLESAAACLRAASGDARPPPLELTVGTRYELGLSFLLPLREAIQGAYPGLSLHCYFGSGVDLLARIRSREIDCAVTSTRFSDPQIDALRLHREDYVFTGARRLLSKRPFTRAQHAADHTLIDVSAELPLFRYWRDAPGGGDRLRFGRVLYLGSGEAIRRLILAGEGVAVLPRYMVARDLARGSLDLVLPSVEPIFDYFRLVFRSGDPHRAAFEAIAACLLAHPLR